MVSVVRSVGKIKYGGFPLPRAPPDPHLFVVSPGGAPHVAAKRELGRAHALGKVDERNEDVQRIPINNVVV